MNAEKKNILPLLVAVIAVGMSSCASNPSANNNSSPTPTATPSIAAFASNTPTVEVTPNITSSPTITSEAPEIKTTSSPSPSVGKLRDKINQAEAKPTKIQTAIAYSKIPSTTETPAGKTTDVTVYTSDAECQELVPQKTQVSSQEPVAGAVGKILEGRDNGDFSLSGYRVNVKNGIATVDLRLSPNSKRILTSLSSCEQFALFGSLRKTLTSNSQWNIKDVRFTEKGEEVAL
ncbi:GerMN domain-containing protein [Brunnivagina elsteri]|uniref:Uncharacterized protein n=1 Tax=Brunnivagina elsteri CCALA 953 TaxID=987040 RepID=A0A2A2TC14_9CYAN|nr:GerMN domain-containing protein [Calothrix elsteri]PAX51185.1 hypothetical protein CK510_26195 [Calothrix elsteri CCALA 953]